MIIDYNYNMIITITCKANAFILNIYVTACYFFSILHVNTQIKAFKGENDFLDEPFF